MIFIVLKKPQTTEPTPVHPDPTHNLQLASQHSAVALSTAAVMLTLSHLIKNDHICV